MPLRLFISVVVLWCAAASPAGAQEATPEESARDEGEGEGDPPTPADDAEAQAQRFFMEARAAFDELRYADARRLLEESLALAPRPSTAINLARVLRSLGEQLEIIATIDALLEGRYGDAAEERLAEARDLRAEAEAALAHIVVSAEGESSVSIRVDGVQMNELAGGASYEQALDPGEHVIVGVTDDGRLEEVTVDLVPGQRREVPLVFGPRLDAEPAPTEEASGTSPWVWVAIAGGALAVGAIVLAVVLATGGGGAAAAARPDPDGVFDVVEALSW